MKNRIPREVHGSERDVIALRCAVLSKNVLLRRVDEMMPCKPAKEFRCLVDFGESRTENILKLIYYFGAHATTPPLL